MGVDSSENWEDRLELVEDVIGRKVCSGFNLFVAVFRLTRFRTGTNSD